MELSKLAIIGLVTLGVGAIVLAGYVVYQLGRNRVLTPPPQADAKDVPERDERTGEPGEVELQLFDGKRYRKAAGQ